MNILLAQASFSSGSDSSWPLVVFILGMVALGLGWMWTTATVTTSVAKEVFSKSPHDQWTSTTTVQNVGDTPVLVGGRPLVEELEPKA